MGHGVQMEVGQKGMEVCVRVDLCVQYSEV